VLKVGNVETKSAIGVSLEHKVLLVQVAVAKGELVFQMDCWGLGTFHSTCGSDDLPGTVSKNKDYGEM
jgi:hypothetical protein